MDAIHAAYERIKERLEACAWSQGERLPPLSQLAEFCEVSRATMWKALAILKQESFVHATKGRAIIAGPAGIPRPFTNKDTLAWERLKNRIGQDILSGEFSGRIFPPATKLASYYGVTARTLHKTLAQLTQEGFIIREGYRYRLTRGQPRTFGSTIMLISSADISGGIDTDEYRTQQVVDSFERECPKAGCICRSAGFNPGNAKSIIELGGIIKSIKNISGFIVNIWDPWNDTIRQRWIDLLTFLTGRNIPVMVIDQAGSLHFPETLQRTPRFRVLRIAGERAGEMVADFLRRSGHKNIAYITPNINFDWVRARYAGLCRYVQRYGGRNSKVELFAHDKAMNQYELMIDLLKLGKQDLNALYLNRLSADQIRSLHPFLSGKQTTISHDDIVSSTIRPAMSILSELARRRHDPRSFSLLQAAVLHAASDHVLELFLHPFLDKVLRIGAATAWVCSEDKTALAVISFLKRKGKRIPGDISVVGFDNWRDAHEHQLSTYDFNMDGMVRQALLMIMDEKMLKTRPFISEVDGYVVERRTSQRLK